MAERYRVRRECEERGEERYLAAPDPPISPPAWFRTDTGLPAVTPLAAEAEEALNHDPSTIKLKWPFGRRQPRIAEGEPTVEEIFARGRP